MASPNFLLREPCPPNPQPPSSLYYEKLSYKQTYLIKTQVNTWQKVVRWQHNNRSEQVAQNWHYFQSGMKKSNCEPQTFFTLRNKIKYYTLLMSPLWLERFLPLLNMEPYKKDDTEKLDYEVLIRFLIDLF